MFDLIEIHRKYLEQNRNDNDDTTTKYKLHTAAVNYANYLLKSGAFSDKEVAHFAKLPLYEIDREKARIEKENKETRRFLATELPS